MSRFRLGVICPNPADGTSWYRCAGPLGHLARHFMPELEFTFLTNQNPAWSDFVGLDALLMQRCCLPTAGKWGREAHSAGVPIWLDYDDAFWHIPPEHPAYWEFQNHIGVTIELLSLATVVTVSTHEVGVWAELHNPNVIVVPNAVDETFIPPAPVRKMMNRYFLAWRGGLGHREDIEHARELLTQPDIRVHYWGHMPPWVRKQDKISPWMATGMYMRQLQLTPASTLVVPLKDNAFNRAKSNCSWLEATWAGLATLHGTETDNHSQLPEFKKPGVLTLQQWLDDAPLGPAREESLAYIQDTLTLAKVNGARAELLRNL